MRSHTSLSIWHRSEKCTFSLFIIIWTLQSVLLSALVSFYVSLTQAPVISEEGTSTEKNACRYVFGAIFLINDWSRRAQPAMSGSIPRRVVLGCIKKVGWASLESKAVSSVLHPISLTSFLSLPWLSLMMDCQLKSTLSSSKMIRHSDGVLSLPQKSK